MRPPADREPAERRLVVALQGAFSGELAASIAYAGHARSVRDGREREEILAIRAEELVHRQRVGRMLAELGVTPAARRERVMRWIGRAISALCRVGGWFVPMYGAGRLERGNIGEYERAARLACAAGRNEFVDELLEMAEVEWDHERYFRAKVASHWMWRFWPKWAPPPPRGTIRSSLDGGCAGPSSIPAASPSSGTTARASSAGS